MSCSSVADIIFLGVVLDLKTKEGVKTLKKLLLDADVFLTNVRLGALQRLGLDWKSLQTEMPHLGTRPPFLLDS